MAKGDKNKAKELITERVLVSKHSELNAIFEIK